MAPAHLIGRGFGLRWRAGGYARPARGIEITMLAFINLTSPWHVLLILVVALLLFGSRLPEVARSMGRAINEFKKGMREVGDDIARDTDEAESEKDKPKLSPPTPPADGPSVPREHPKWRETESDRRD
jgi:sec-independent protein translocase protein TatA